MATVPLRTLLERNDYTSTIQYSGDFPNNPSRTAINDMVAEWSNGAILDGKLPKTVAFRVRANNGKSFFMHYVEELDEYWFEKATVRG
jgi:hypothetical protein